MLKNKIIEFLKRYAILIGVVIFLLILLSIKNATIKSQTKKIVEIEQSNLAYNNDRIYLEKQIQDSATVYKSIKGSNDSLKKVLSLYQLELSNLKKKHSQELADLTKIPKDTVFVRLQTLYTNYDNEPLKYPFSGFQIAQIYSTSISYDMIQQEYSLQGKSLKSCLGLNAGYEKGISNLNSQISNLNENLSKSDLQIQNYNKEVSTLNKRVNRKSFWNKLLLGVSATAIGIAVIK